MDKHRILQAYELLIALIVTFQGNIKQHLQFLEKLSEKFDAFFECEDFTIILNKFQKKSFNTDQKDILFVDLYKLPLSYSNLNILNLKERIILYTCIFSWFEKENYMLFEKGFLKKVFLLDDEILSAIHAFFSKNNMYVPIGKNELFLLEPEKTSEETLEGEWVKSNKPEEKKSTRSFNIREINHTIKVLYLEQVKVFLLTCEDCTSLIEKQNKSNSCEWGFLEPGEKVLFNKKKEFTYHDLKSLFLSERYSQKLQMKVSGLKYSYSNGKGIKKFSMEIAPGNLLGVLGKEGSGKSTLLKLLAGEISARNGEIIINGYNLNKDLYQMKGMIGFVPEDDLLYNELTIYENLILTAKLYLGKTSSNEIHQKVDSLLKDLDLSDLKNTLVGSEKDKYLQPGQRRLLNIALELLRDPQILIVDNATTPLSLADSSKIIEVLANYTFKGKIVITAITQANKQSFAEFDNLLVIDDGGFPVYNGSTNKVLDYFSILFEQKPNVNEAITPDAIIQIINCKKYGGDTSEQIRFKSPADLYNSYKESEKKLDSKNLNRKILPEKLLHPPTLQRQYIIFFLRNFKSKIARRRELLYAVLVTPFLALVISLFLRQSNNTDYSYSTNPNIPVYLFLSIIIAIFLGLIQSANEIFKEKNVNKKQEYLNLSRFSYINSKITYLFVISIIQSFLFVSIGNNLLLIKGSLWFEWLIFFSCQSFGLLLGLVFSNTQRTLDSIYTKSIPIALVIQIILGGYLIKLDSVNHKHNNYTPWYSDLVVSRWAYEASMIYRFKQNLYEKEFYEYDRDISSGRINSLYLLPAIKSQVQLCQKNYQKQSDSIDLMLGSIRETLDYLSGSYEIFPYENRDKLNTSDFDSVLAKDLLEYLEYLELHFYSLHVNSVDLRAIYQKRISDSLGNSFLHDLKSKYHNYAIANEVTNEKFIEPLQFYNNRPIQVKDAIFKYPDSDIGRGQMYIPEKQFSGQIIDTIEFNISIIWLINLMLYILLVTGVPGNLAYQFKNFR